jgi:hypothetical protein
MSLETALIGAAAELVPKLVSALSAGDRRVARDLAEEVARRQAFELKQRAQSELIKKARGKR